MSSRVQYRIVQFIAALLALMYVDSARKFVFTHQIDFVHYVASSPVEVWTVRNLGLRLLAIAAGFIIALVAKDRRMPAMMFAVRLVADAGDTLNSAMTPGLASFVVPVLGLFAAVELGCLIVLLRMKDEVP